MIDFHCHVIPYVDDGAKNLDMSIQMLEMSFNDGVEYICATPHFIAGESEIERLNYDEKLNNLKEISKIKDLSVKILNGLELYIHPELPKLYKDGKVWGINDSNYLLIELPMNHFPLYTEEVFYELRLMGATPILAHPERNSKLRDNIKLLENLIDQGTLTQVTSGSLNGLYGKDVKAFAELLVKKNMVHLVGSDAHNNSGRNTMMKKEYEIIKEINKDLFNWIEENQFNIINNKSVNIPEIIRIKKRVSFFKKFF